MIKFIKGYHAWRKESIKLWKVMLHIAAIIIIYVILIFVRAFVGIGVL